MPSLFRHGITWFLPAEVTFCIRGTSGSKEVAEGGMSHSGMFSNFKCFFHWSQRFWGRPFLSYQISNQPVGSYLMFQEFSAVIKRNQVTYSE